MIIRPCSYDLATAVQRIEEDRRIAFGIIKDTIFLPELEEGWPEIDHLNMTGPTRAYVRRKGKNEHDYTGPIWVSEIRLFSRVVGASEYFREQVLGESSRILPDGVWTRRSLRYDFPVDHQPEQESPAPHIVHLEFREKVGSSRRVFGSIGDLRDRILYTPRLYKHWCDAPNVVALARAELARR